MSKDQGCTPGSRTWRRPPASTCHIWAVSLRGPVQCKRRVAGHVSGAEQALQHRLHARKVVHGAHGRETLVEAMRVVGDVPAHFGNGGCPLRPTPVSSAWTASLNSSGTRSSNSMKPSVTNRAIWCTSRSSLCAMTSVSAIAMPWPLPFQRPGGAGDVYPSTSTLRSSQNSFASCPVPVAALRSGCGLAWNTRQPSRMAARTES